MLRILQLSLIFIFLLILSFSINAQDHTIVVNDGKIVEIQQLEIESPWSDSVDCYRMKYLSDGLKVVGFIVKPKADGKKYPVIIYNRGGNREYSKINDTTLTYFSYLSSNGYVVLASQYRGNDGGEGVEEFGGDDVNDVLNLIKTAKSLPYVEKKKIAMLGYSRGGMMTYIAIKRNADIKTAAVVGGITDLHQIYYEREDMQSIIEELVGLDEAEWERRSAYFWPEKINVPVLILHGEDDWRVAVSHAEKLSEKLKDANKVHKLIVFPGGDHYLNTHRPERNQNIFDWFEFYLSLDEFEKKPSFNSGVLMLLLDEE